MTLLARLFLIVAIAVLPAIGIQAYSAFAFREQLIERARVDLLQLARLQAASLDRLVSEAHDFAVALSELSSAKEPRPEFCGPYLQRLGPRFPQYAGIVIADRTGHTICAASDVDDLDIAERPAFKDAMATGGFATGVFAVGRVTGKKLLPFAAPIRDGAGTVLGAVVITLDLDWLAEHTNRVLPQGTSLNIADRDGTILVRHPDNGFWAGRPMPEQNLWILHEPREGVVEVSAIDGKLRVIAYEPLAVTPSNLHVGVTIEKAALVAGVEDATRHSLALTLIAAALAAFAAWLLGQRLVRQSIGALLGAIRQWQTGHFGVRAPLSEVREIGLLGRAFNELAEAIAARDAALRRAEEKAVQHERDFSRLLVENISEAVFAYDRGLRVTAWNPATERISGYRREEALGRSLYELFALRVDAVAEAAFRGALAGRRTSLQSHRYEVRPTGRKGLFDGDFAPLSDQDGQIIGGIAFVRDTTERHTLEEAVRRAHRMEAVGQLTGGVAHDFNNLLTVIGGNLDRLGISVRHDARLRGLVDAAQRGVERGARLVSGLLAFARRQRLNPVVVDLNAIIGDCRDLLRRGAGEAVEFRLALAPALWPCRVDPTQFEVALLNLVINAHDAMPNGGKITIETRNVELGPEATLAMMDASPGAYVLVAVADTGTGMPPEVLQQAFEPFFTTKDVGKGSGLGLSQVYGFAKQSGGHVAAESEPGAGTTIRLYLPKSGDAPGPGEPPRPAGREIAGTERVLLVEDNEAILETTAGLLGELGYGVVRAKDAHEALERFDAEPAVDLVFSDIVLPGGMSGLELAAVIAARSPATKILLTTGYAASLSASGGERWPILPKPYHREALATKLREVLVG